MTDDLRDRADDSIWRLRWGADWLYVYLLLEFQSTVDVWMAVRIQTYLGLLYQDLIRAEQLSANGRLPPVLPLVLYNGATPWSAALNLESLIEPAPSALEPYRPQQAYLLLDERRLAERADLPVRNLSAALFRLEASRDAAQAMAILTALVEWLQSPEHASLRRAFGIWLARVFLPKRLPQVALPPINDLIEVNTMLAENLEAWTDQWLHQGWEKGRKEGREEGRGEGRDAVRHLLLRQVSRRMGQTVADETAPLLARIENLAQFEELGDQLLLCADEKAWLAAVRSTMATMARSLPSGR